MRNSKYILFGLVLVLWFVMPAAAQNQTDQTFEVLKNLDIYSNLIKELNAEYVDEIQPGELTKTAIDAMLESLDPYTNFIPESEVEDYKFITTGQYGGIGALIHQQGDYVIISEPYEGSPAQKSDLRAGDKILEVNGQQAKGKTYDEVSAILKGQAGTSVALVGLREGSDKPIEKSITREIIKHQGEFFAEGVSKLKPLTMTQIADIIGVHETTVSRALANKYIKTPHGVFEMKYFFTSGYQSDAGQSVANTSVKEMIADIIAGEDPGKPLSDQEIVGLLEAKGLKIARRTVAKYREELGLLPSNLRRRYD